MAAGIPGAGIGGLFYLASAVLLPVRTLWRRVRGVPDTIGTRELAFQLAIAIGIVGGIALAGWLLALALPSGSLTTVTPPGAREHGVLGHSVVRIAAVAAGFITLFLVLGGVEVVHLVLRPRRATSARPRTDAPPR